MVRLNRVKINLSIAHFYHCFCFQLVVTLHSQSRKSSEYRMSIPGPCKSAASLYIIQGKVMVFLILDEINIKSYLTPTGWNDEG
jgi:hypothetical protein